LKKNALLSRIQSLAQRHRRSALAIVVFACAFMAWFLATLPSLYARVKLDRSFPALSRYEFEMTPDFALVGSSMTFRLFEGYFLKTRPRNIAIGGGSALTGLAIIASYQNVPRLILVETNILSRPVDEALVGQFGKNDAEPYRWFRPIRATISFVYYWIKYKSEAENVNQLPSYKPSDYDISASVATTLEAYSGTKLDEAMVRNAEALKRLVANLEGRGCQILFYELPYPDALGNTHYAVTARSLVRAAFPDSKKWLGLDFRERQLRWVDAAHMDERSAVLVAQEIERLVRSVR
jgi:hypothetical protein